MSKTSKLDGSVETYSYDSQNRLVGLTCSPEKSWI
ncbi:RHS repeat domain-containing protein [Tateyamaria sp. 1078]